MEIPVSREEKAERLFREGYNCSQAVFGAFSEDYGIDEKLAMKISSSFGGGFARLREVCGTFSGICMVVGMETGATQGKDIEQKKKNYEKVRKLAERFEKDNGSIICRELLGIDKEGRKVDAPTPEERTEEYYKKRPCIALIKYAVSLLEEEFSK